MLKDLFDFDFYVLDLNEIFELNKIIEIQNQAWEKGKLCFIKSIEVNESDNILELADLLK